MTDTTPTRARKRAVPRGGNASSDRPVTDLAPPPTGPAEHRAPEPDADRAGHRRFLIVAGILPRDENTQAVLSAEVDEWWRALPLATRLGVHAAIRDVEL